MSDEKDFNDGANNAPSAPQSPTEVEGQAPVHYHSDPVGLPGTDGVNPTNKNQYFDIDLIKKAIREALAEANTGAGKSYPSKTIPQPAPGPPKNEDEGDAENKDEGDADYGIFY